MGDPLRLYGLNALVLNAADGIGEAISRTLIKHGATVIAADTSNSGVVQHYASVKGITGMVANLNDPERLSTLVDEAAEILGGIDILVTDFLLRQEAPLSKADEKLENVLRLRATLVMAAFSASDIRSLSRSSEAFERTSDATGKFLRIRSWGPSKDGTSLASPW